MAWIRWRAPLNGRRLARRQLRDELESVHSKALRTDNPAVAQIYLRGFERTHGARTKTPALRSAMDVLHTYIDEKRLGARSATIEMCRARLEPLFGAWASTPMHQWTRALFVRYVADHTDWGPRSIQMFVGECRRFIRWAGAEGSGVACPDFVGDFRCPTLQQEELKHLEPEQVALLPEAVRGTKWEPPVALAALAGLRRAEFYGLQTSDIDWDRQVLLVQATKTHRDARLKISPPLMEILKRHRVVAGPVVRLGPHIRAAYTGLHRFCRRVHLKLRVAKCLADPASGRTKKREALVRARADWDAGGREFPAIGWHTLRHSFASALLANGVGLRTVQDLMREKTAAMTMRYAHSTSERRRAAVGKVLA